MTTLTITLPWPASELSPNYHGHWKPKWRAQQLAKSDGLAATLEGIQMDPARFRALFADKPLAVRYTFQPPNKRPRDRDNAEASLKHFADGIAEALQTNDHYFRPSYAWGDVWRGGRVMATISAAEAERVTP